MCIHAYTHCENFIYFLFISEQPCIIIFIQVNNSAQNYQLIICNAVKIINTLKQPV